MRDQGQEESIYNLIPRESVEREKTQRHKSKFRRSVVDEVKEKKDLRKTLGPAKVETRPPDQFLRKHEKEPRLPPDSRNSASKFKYPDAESRKPPVPSVKERPVMGLRTEKNFITENAVHNIMAEPRQPQRIAVDTRRGDKMLLPPSGLEPTYIHKKNYGETPAYVAKRKEELKQKQDEYDAYVAEHFRKGAMKQLSDEEKLQILNGLKDNWEELQHEYLQLSVMIDTVPKIHYKEKLEGQLKQLEKDIEMLEVHDVIYVAN